MTFRSRSELWTKTKIRLKEKQMYGHHGKYARIFVHWDIICSEKWTVFWECSSRKTVSFEEQNMSKDKYLSIFLPQMEAIMFIILQIFFTTCTVLKIGEYSRIFPSFFSGRIFGHVTCLNQSRESESIWWIINIFIIHQIFSLAHDWSKCVTWANIPLLKLGNIREYSPIFKPVRVAKKMLRIIRTL